MEFIKINPKDINGNAFKMIGNDWLLITGGDASGFNSMTASWGTFGILWGRPITECFIRNARHTLGFMENCEYYTLSLYDEKYRSELSLFGTKSGRDIDKVKETGFTPAFADCGAVYYEEAELVIVCKKIYVTDLDPAKMQPAIIDKFHTDNDFHRIFMGEIVEVLKKRDSNKY